MGISSPSIDDLALKAALRDPARLAVLRATELLDAPTEAAFDRLARLAAKLLGVPLAAVTLAEVNRQFYTACVGLPEPVATARELPMEMSICRYVVVSGATLVIPDTRKDPRTSELASVTELGVHAYAGVPLVVHGQVVGTLCVMDYVPRDWTEHQIDVLTDLAASVMTEIELRLAVRESDRQSRAMQEIGAALRTTTRALSATNEELTTANDVADAEHRRLEAVLDALPVGVFIADAEGRITHTNRQVGELWGGVHGAVHPHVDGRMWWAESGRPVLPDEWPLARALATGEQSVNAAIDIARLDGRLATILASAAPVRDGNGRIIGGVAAVLDVTSRVRSERALRQLAAAALAVTRKSTLDEVLQEVTEQARGIVGANQAITSVTTSDDWTHVASAVSFSGEYAMRESGAANVRPDGTAIHAFVREMTAPLRLTHEQLNEQPAIQQIAMHWQRRGSIGGWLAAPLVGGDGRNIGLIQLCGKSDSEFSASDEAILVQLAQMASAAVEKAQADGSVRANAERTRRLLAVTEALSEAVTPQQVAGVVVAAVIESLGAQAASVSVLTPAGHEATIVSATGYPDPMVDAWRCIPLDAPVPVSVAIRTGEPIWLGGMTEIADRYPELAVLRELPDLVASAVLPLTVEGRAVGALVVSFDEPQAFEADDRAVLTAVARQCAQALERARLYDAERLAREAAEAANRAKFDFLATMSHELRTPLNAIGGYVDLIEMGIRGPVTDEQQRDLERIKRAQHHLLGLINDVLNFAKLDAGRVRYAMADVLVAEAVASVESMIAPQLRDKGLGYTAVPCPEGLLARADAEKLRQVLLNLLSNALKFTEPGGAITVRCDADESHVQLRVVDDGMGIPADKMATIFDPFVQVDRGLSRPSEGIGLGLAISRDLARGMGGELTVESDFGRGSIFSLTLPRATR